MAEQNAINAPVSAFGKTLIDDADQPTAVGTLFNNASLTSTTIATDDLVIIQDSSNSKAVRTVTTQQIADLAGAGAAPADATYIVQVPNGTLSNEQALSALATGIMKSDNGTGVVSIAVQGTDYYAPGGTDVAIADGGTGASTNTAGINNLVSNAALTPATVASSDLVLIQDASDTNNLKSVTAQSIADLGPGGSAAPGDATYIVQTPDASLTNEQALSLLSTGIMKNTTSTGVVSIATANVDYQAADATLISIAALGTAADRTLYTTGADTWAETPLTAAGRAIIDDATAGDQRTTLGLGTIATQNSSSVSITGGSITGITDLAVVDGGTSSSSFIAYSPICGGTTSTNPLQSVASVGVAGQILTSNGPGALPTFQAAGGGGSATYVRVALTPTQFQNMRLTPIEIIPAQGANTLISVSSIFIELAMAGTAFANGGDYGLQYNNTAALAGSLISSASIIYSNGFTTNRVVFFPVGYNSFGTSDVRPILYTGTNVINQGVYITNRTANFTGGTGATVYVNCIYSVLTAT